MDAGCDITDYKKNRDNNFLHYSNLQRKPGTDTGISLLVIMRSFEDRCMVLEMMSGNIL